MNFNFDFSGRTVLVTGGVSGIGAAVTQAFGRSGAAVIACGLTDAELDAARTDPAYRGCRIERLDVRDTQAVNGLMGSIDRLDALVCCAGMIRRDAEHDPDIFADVVDVNLTGSMRCAAAARRLLARQGGSIVLIGSVMSYFGGPKQPAYSASKGGVRNLTMSLAAAYAAEGIRVNAVAPGWVMTDLSRGAREDPVRNAAIASRTPIGRWANTDEIADPVLFLCSDAARYMTGALVNVDGGYTAVG
jgi:NAD(P)-dependent dehydrogenase (short-subunit alcohol dehydrogenase family)